MKPSQFGNQENRPTMDPFQGSDEIVRLQNILASKDNEIQSLNSRLLLRENEMSSNSDLNYSRLLQENQELRASLQALQESHNLLGLEHDRLLQILKEKDESINLFGEENIRLRREMEAAEMKAQESQTRLVKQNLDAEELANILDDKERAISRMQIQIEEAEKIMTVFKYQIIYDPEIKKFRNLEKVPNDIKLDNHYIGNKFEPIKDFIEGILDFKTLKERKRSETDYDRMVRFINFDFSKHVVIRNLCDNVITYDNFDQFE